MVELEFHASAWKSSGDFYDALLAALGAPAWHGRNLDALEDSIFAGGINKVSPPFRIIIRTVGPLPAELRETLSRAAQMFEAGQSSEGIDAYFELRP